MGRRCVDIRAITEAVFAGRRGERSPLSSKVYIFVTISVFRPNRARITALLIIGPDFRVIVGAKRRAPPIPPEVPYIEWRGAVVSVPLTACIKVGGKFPCYHSTLRLARQHVDHSCPMRRSSAASPILPR